MSITNMFVIVTISVRKRYSLSEKLAVVSVQLAAFYFSNSNCYCKLHTYLFTPQTIYRICDRRL
jgi:hypothetical protein